MLVTPNWREGEGREEQAGDVFECRPCGVGAGVGADEHPGAEVAGVVGELLGQVGHGFDPTYSRSQAPLGNDSRYFGGWPTTDAVDGSLSI